MELVAQRPIAAGSPLANAGEQGIDIPDPDLIEVGRQAKAQVDAGLDEWSINDIVKRKASAWWYLIPVVTGLGCVALIISGAVLAHYKIHNAQHTSGNQFNDGAINGATKATIGSGVVYGAGLAASLGATVLKGFMDSARVAFARNAAAGAKALKASWVASFTSIGEAEGIMANAVCGFCALASKVRR